MTKKVKLPLEIMVPVYYAREDDGSVEIDVEEMAREFEQKVATLKEMLG